MLVDGIIIMNAKFLDCGNAIQPILLACMKLKWLTLEIEKLIDKVSSKYKKLPMGHPKTK